MNHGHAVAIPVDDAVVSRSAALGCAQAAAVGQCAVANDRCEQRRRDAGDRTLAQLHTAGVVRNAGCPGPLRKRVGRCLLVAKHQNLGGITSYAEHRPVVRCQAAVRRSKEESAGDSERVGVAAARRTAASLGDGDTNRRRQNAIRVALQHARACRKRRRAGCDQQHTGAGVTEPTPVRFNNHNSSSGRHRE